MYKYQLFSKSKVYLFIFFIDTDAKQFLYYFTVGRYTFWIGVTLAFKNFLAANPTQLLQTFYMSLHSVQYIIYHTASRYHALTKQT